MQNVDTAVKYQHRAKEGHSCCFCYKRIDHETTFKACCHCGEVVEVVVMGELTNGN